MSEMSKKKRILKRVRDAESATPEGFDTKSKKARSEPPPQTPPQTPPQQTPQTPQQTPPQTPQQRERAQQEHLRAKEQLYRASLQAAAPAPQMPPPMRVPAVQARQHSGGASQATFDSLWEDRRAQMGMQALLPPRIGPAVPSPAAAAAFALPDAQQRQLLEALRRAEQAMRALDSAQCTQSDLLEAQLADQALQQALMCALMQATRVAKNEMPINQLSSEQQIEELRRRAQPLREQLQRARAQERALHALVERKRAAPPAPIAPRPPPLAPPPIAPRPPPLAPPPRRPVVLLPLPRPPAPRPEGHR